MIRVEKRDKYISNAKLDDLKLDVFENRTLAFDNCKIKEIIIELGRNAVINFKLQNKVHLLSRSIC